MGINWRMTWGQVKLYIFLALLLPVLAGCSFIPGAGEEKAPPLQKLKEEAYETVPVKRGEILNRVMGAATLVPRQEYAASFKTEGILESVDVVNGQAVSKGDILARLNTSDLMDRIRAQELELEKLRLTYAKMRAVPGIDPETLHLSWLDVDSAIGRLNMLREEYEGNLLRAPADGVVEYIEPIHSGDYVAPYQDIIQLANPDKLVVSYALEDLEGAMPFNKDTSVKVTIGKRKYKGKIEATPFSVSPYERKEKYAKAILVGVKKLPSKCRMGDTVGVEFVFQDKENVLILPKRALRTYLSRQYVVVMEGNTRKEVDVEIGLKGPASVEILSGLKEGQQVIMR